MVQDSLEVKLGLKKEESMRMSIIRQIAIIIADASSEL